jgi:putative endonuclease
MAKQFYVYIMTNPTLTVLYTGVTSRLQQRVYEHQAKLVPGFTSRYNVTILVYYEACPDAQSAIAREKQIKAGSRQRKLDLIDSINPTWRDLSQDILG